jgi:hypothetical protein
MTGESQREKHETADDADVAETASGPQIPQIHTDLKREPERAEGVASHARASWEARWIGAHLCHLWNLRFQLFILQSSG